MLCIKGNKVQMRGHNNKSIDTQFFVLMAVVEAFCDDEAGFSRDENRQPVNNSKGQVIEGDAILNLIDFHVVICSRLVARRDAGHSTRFVERFQYAAEGVMHHAVPKRGGADFAFFTVLNEEVAIGTGAVRFVLQFPLDLEQFTLRIKFKGSYGGFVPLAFPCFMPGIVQIGEAGYLWVEIFRCFHELRL